MSLLIKPITRKSADYKKIAALMKSSFPAEERIPMWWLTHLSKRADVSFYAYYDAVSLCGITYTIETSSMVFLLYFAVYETCRSKGYGSMILSQLKERTAGKELIINLEQPDETAPNNIQRKRRICFYERNGFALCDFTLSVAGTDYAVMSISSMPDIVEFQTINTRYHLGKIKA